MSLLALLLVLCSAITQLHWNAEVKNARQPEVYSLLLQVTGIAFAIVTALFLGDSLSFPWQGWAFIGASGLSYGAYYMFVAKSFSRGDLSIAYPIIRGSAPIFSVLIGLLLLSSAPSKIGFLGIGIICVGVLMGILDSRDANVKFSFVGIGLAIITGLCTACYMTFDNVGPKWTQSVLLSLGFAYIPGSIFQWLALRTQGVKISLKFSRPEWIRLLLASLSNTFGYSLVMVAMMMSKGSYIVAARSVGVVLSLAVGALFFKEKISVLRIVAACVILAGIVTITLA